MKYPIPANDADFELLCLEILRVHWDCPSLDLYAHRGEEQFGVDILDLSGNAPLRAAQCKLHEEWLAIMPAEIRQEIRKAEGFRPPLGHYAILTTAKSSRAAHDEVLKINKEHSERGLFQVELITWGKIENLLDRYDRVKDNFYATPGGQTVAEIRERVAAIHEAVVPKPDTVLPQQNSPAPIPMADAGRFSLALAHLTHDDGQAVERLILESIRGVTGVQVLLFDRTLSAEGPIPEQSEGDAHEVARTLLRESSADALIWGTVLSHSGRTAPRLYWTTAESSMRSALPYVPENFSLPQLFWEDLAEVLRLFVVTRSAKLFAQTGCNITPELAPFVEKVRNLLERGHMTQRWTAGTTTRVMFILAMALEQLGEQTGCRDHLTQSVHYYRQVLATEMPTEDRAFHFAVHNNLGVALGALGSLESESSHLLEAVAIFREALNAVRLREYLPLSWACLQRNLGNGLLLVGERESGGETLRQAAQAYQAALSEWTRERSPLDWATLQNSLGYALQVAGSRESRKDLLLAAITCHRSALEELARERVPMYWAHAQNNLGGALKGLGEQQAGIGLLEEAANAYRLALAERPFEREPLAWAEAKNNLAGVLIQIADVSGDPAGLGEAVIALRESLKVRTREASPMGFASSKNNLGRGLFRLGEYENQPAHLSEAIDSFRDALQIWTRESTPARWSIAQHNLADALASLGKKEKSLARLDEAKAAYGQALIERHREREPLLWAATQAGLGMVHYVRGELEPNTESLESAVRHFRLALEEFRPDVAPSDRCGVQLNLGNVLRLLGQRKNDPALVLEGLGNHATACGDWLPYSPYWAFRAADEAVADAEALKSNHDPSVYQSALQDFDWVLGLRSKHEGHRIGLGPLFTIVVAGTSGTKKPDFSSAPKRGDRIKDGTVVWENAGKYSFCEQCGHFLAVPPKGRNSSIPAPGP
jgi:tetratricopeptide (TPR) repeat protein